MALLISDGNGGYERYGTTRQALLGQVVDLKSGEYAYKGDLYRIDQGHAIAFSEISTYKPGGRFTRVKAEIKFRFDAEQYQERINMSFKPIADLAGAIPDKFEDEVRKYLGFSPLLGYFTSPHKVTMKSGSISIADDNSTDKYTIVRDKCHGEGEIGEINNVREPTLYYNYLCGIDPDKGAIHMNISSGTLRNEREDYFKDAVDKMAGKLIEKDGYKNVVLKDTMKDSIAIPEITDKHLLTLVNDQYSTGIFLRRIVRMESGGGSFFGLEEFMAAVDTSPLPADNPREAHVGVYTYKGAGDVTGKAPEEGEVLEVYNSPEKFDVLDKAVEETGFLADLERVYADSSKSKEDFSIVIKPNFMFFYNRDDKSTFTDPALVGHLVKRIHGEGFTNIKVAEARSTLSVFFDNRDVKTSAKYLGYVEDGNYEIVDMSENVVGHDFGGMLGTHDVNRDWKEADYRISFAKNKTHSYAYYTLTMKNIYGAFPDTFKFKVFHADMKDIYTPTIEFIKEFPIHFGFIDAVVSSDGPFGIFASPYPELTQTIIAGKDIVAVDWVAASKMGINPMLSKYMQGAVKAFGKPRIRITGNDLLYKYWINIPRIASEFSHLLDEDFTFGYAIYYLMSQMDTRHFPQKPSYYELMTEIKPYLRDVSMIVYKDPLKPPSAMNKVVNKVLLRMWN